VEDQRPRPRAAKSCAITNGRTAAPGRWAASFAAVVLMMAVSACSRPSSLERPPAADGVAVGRNVWGIAALPGSNPSRSVAALTRDAVYPPVRMRVWVIPGSGCSGMAAVAERYFAGLLHAQVVVLHKNGVSPRDDVPPERCSAEFVRNDSPSAWRADLIAAITHAQGLKIFDDNLPQYIVGISEGGELAPHIVPEVRNLRGLVLISSAGLDPIDVATLRFKSPEMTRAWSRVVESAAGPEPGSTVVQGRSLRYWRDFLTWRTADALHAGPWPLLQAWGTKDEAIPQEAFDQFSERQDERRVPYCRLRLSGADHDLQGPGRKDGVQRVWAAIEDWARTGKIRCP